MRAELIRVDHLRELPEDVPPAGVASQVLLVTGRERVSMTHLDRLARRALLRSTETIAVWGPYAEWIHDVIDETFVAMCELEGSIDDSRFMDTHWMTHDVTDLDGLAETVELYRHGFGYHSDEGVPLGWVGVIVVGCDDDVWRTASRAHAA